MYLCALPFRFHFYGLHTSKPYLCVCCVECILYLGLCDSNQRPKLLQWQQTETSQQINKQIARIGKRALLFCSTFWPRLPPRILAKTPTAVRLPMPDSSFSFSEFFAWLLFCSGNAQLWQIYVASAPCASFDALFEPGSDGGVRSFVGVLLSKHF